MVVYIILTCVNLIVLFCLLLLSSSFDKSIERYENVLRLIENTRTINKIIDDIENMKEIESVGDYNV